MKEQKEKFRTAKLKPEGTEKEEKKKLARQIHAEV